jgi:hypothetical protein
MGLAGFLGMSSGMKRMASRRVGMMCGFLVVSAVVMLGRFAMMVGSVGMMFCGMSMMFGCFFRHEYHLCYEFSVAEKAGPAMINDPAVRLPSVTWPTGRGWGMRCPGPSARPEFAEGNIRPIVKLRSLRVVPVTVLLQ